MDKSKVLILFCGGTIIMKPGEDGAYLPMAKDEAIDMLLNLEPKIHDKIDLDVHYVDNIDSVEMVPEQWDEIAQTIADKYDDYDGFVVTHGTDTMAYTSSALSFALQDLGKPVVLTGSQIPGEKIETDARRNFVNAVRLATMDLSAVCIVFDEEIILGARATKVSESKLDAFETVNWDLLGEIRIDIQLSDEAKPRLNTPLNLQTGFEANIAVITLMPGLPASAVEGVLDSGVKGIVLRAFGSGNISNRYIDVIKKAKSMDVPIVVDTQCMEGATIMHVYDAGKQALDAGVIQAYDMSIECIITKLMWSLKHAKSYEDIETMMHANYTGEINTERKIY